MTGSDMRRLVWLSLAAVLIAATPDARRIAVAAEDQHAYFNALVARADHWKSYSFRDASQLNYPKLGGFAHSNSSVLRVTYSPATDTDPNAQDAAKVTIPAFEDRGQTGGTSSYLSQGYGPDDTVLRLTYVSTGMTQGVPLLIDNEIVVLTTARDLANSTVTVKRGQFGTTAAPHPSGALVKVGTNSLANQVRIPLGTSDGHTYLFTWDVYFTDSYLNSGLTNFKAFQLASKAGEQWIEPNTRFDGGANRSSGFKIGQHVAAAELRGYGGIGGEALWSSTDRTAAASVRKWGPSITVQQPLSGQLAHFIIHPNRWTRWWVRVEQRAYDYDFVDVWIADEEQSAVQLYSRAPGSLGLNNSMTHFWIEFNTSTVEFTRGDFRDFVAYVRNFAALVDPPTDVSSLLLRPHPSEPLPPPTGRPTPPRNPRTLPGE